jgi:hypothetical protein
LNLSLGFTATYAEVGHEEHCPDINGPGCAGMAVEPEWHALKLFFSDVRLRAEYGITSWLSFDLMWALRIVDIQFQLQDAATRRPIAPPFGEEIHHRTETIAGLGDPWLGLRGARQLGMWGLAFRLGFTIPVGSTVENPFALGRAGKSHQHIQLGTGTVDWFVGAEAQRQLGRFALTGWLLAKLVFYENHHHYRAGHQVLGGLEASSALWTRDWRFTLGTLVYHEEAERWSGAVETEGNLGRTDLMLESRVGWRFSGPWSLLLGVRFPVYTHAVGGQLNTPALGSLTISRPFDPL